MNWSRHNAAAGLCETWTVDRHPLASVGTLVLAAHGVRDRRRCRSCLVRPTAGSPPTGFGIITRAKSLRTPAGRCLGGNWIGQKKDKSGKRKAADKDRPVPHVEAKNSTLRHCGDEL